MEAKRKIVKVVIDRNKCIGAASCVSVAPEGFDLDDEGKAVLKRTCVNLDDETLLMAAKVCPTRSIFVYDEKGRQIYPEPETEVKEEYKPKDVIEELDMFLRAEFGNCPLCGKRTLAKDNNKEWCKNCGWHSKPLTH